MLEARPECGIRGGIKERDVCIGIMFCTEEPLVPWPILGFFEIVRRQRFELAHRLRCSSWRHSRQGEDQRNMVPGV
jgi:hypothetical protein